MIRYISSKISDIETKIALESGHGRSIRVLEQQAESFRREFNELKIFPVSNTRSPIVYIGMAADIIHHGHMVRATKNVLDAVSPSCISNI